MLKITKKILITHLFVILSLSYSLVALSADFDFEQEFTVVKVEIQEFSQNSGFDPTLSPPWLMVPVANDNKIKALITPATSTNNVDFESTKATVSPATASNSPEIVTLTGVTKGEGELKAKVGTVACSTLGLSVKNRLTKKVAIHAITEENDDVKLIEKNKGKSNSIAITAGANSIIDTTPAGDDQVNSNTITTGADGVCNTAATGDDIQVIAINKGKANEICVTAGFNAERDTIVSGDDVVDGENIKTGPDGICQSEANSTNISPVNVPSAAALQAYLNSVWGKQSNVYFVVTRTDATVNYDVNRNGKCADSPLTEIERIDTAAKDTTSDFNIYYVNAMEVPNASTIYSRGYTWIGDSHQNSNVNITAHEIGHLLGRSGESNNIEDVMLSYSSSTNPYRVIKVDWDAVNP